MILLLKFIKNHWKKIVIILLFPFVLDGILRFIWQIPISIKESASLGEWLGFLGAYFGIIGAIGGIWWQLNEEKRKQQLGSLRIIEYYLTILSSRLGETTKNFENKKVKFYKYMFFNGLFIDNNLLEHNKDYSIISKKDIKILNDNIKNISSLNSYINIFKIINALEHIEEISSNCLSQNNFSKIIEKIVTTLQLDNSQIILILKTKLTLNYYKNKHAIPYTFLNKLSPDEIDNILKNVKNISNIEELFSIIRDIFTIMQISLKLGTIEIYSELYKISHHLLDIGYILWGNKDNPEIYTFETLEIEINDNLEFIKKEIKKLS